MVADPAIVDVQLKGRSAPGSTRDLPGYEAAVTVDRS
jgi:hypothetical protein